MCQVCSAGLFMPVFNISSLLDSGFRGASHIPENSFTHSLNWNINLIKIKEGVL
jgi:hypothetical protein